MPVNAADGKAAVSAAVGAGERSAEAASTGELDRRPICLFQREHHPPHKPRALWIRADEKSRHPPAIITPASSWASDTNPEL